MRTGMWAWALFPYPIFLPFQTKPRGFCGRKASRKKEDNHAMISPVTDTENHRTGIITSKVVNPNKQNLFALLQFNAVRRQVPEEFRAWVRQYVRQWYAKGGEAACQVDSLPDGAPIDFPRWLNRFLQRYTARHAGKAADGAPEMAEEGEEEGEEEMLAAPEGLSPVYYRWLCLFVRRFCLRQATNEGGKGTLVI